MINIITSIFLFISLYLILFYGEIKKDKKMAKAIKGTRSKEEYKFSTLYHFIEPLTKLIYRYVKLEDYKKEHLEKNLNIAGIEETPEYYTAKRISISITIFVMIFIISLFTTTFFIYAGVVLSFIIYKEQMQEVDNIIKKNREEVEGELPHFTSVIYEYIKGSRDIVRLIENYAVSTNEYFRRELSRTVIEMKTGNTERALLALEGRVNSSKLSKVTRGLVGVARGENQELYFYTLYNDFAKDEKEKLRKLAQSYPRQLLPFSYGLLFIILVIIIYVLMFSSVGIINNM